jgi:chromate reductase, NAD(P)H dehydrogenase (quinone)
MADEITIFAIAGSLRKDSFNRAALRAASQLVPNGMKLDIFEDLEAIPPFNQDLEWNPAAEVVDMKARIRASSGVLFVTPEYNYGMPGVLKNAIDWASRPYGDSAWDGLPAAVMGASTSLLGSARAQYQLRQAFVFLNMFPVNRPEVMIASASTKFNERGELVDETSRKLIGELLEELERAARGYQAQKREESREGVYSGFRPQGYRPSENQI